MMNINLSKNKGLLLIGMLIMVLMLTACGQSPTTTDTAATDTTSSDTEMTFTVDELAQYNGQDGNPAYIAVDGVVYDVTDVPFWKGGMHNGFEAGQDLTEEIKTISPHGVSKLEGIPVVGKLEE